MKNIYTNEVIVNALNRFYPDVAADIENKIDELIPEPIVEIDRISDIIIYFSEIKGFDLNHITGSNINGVYIKYRKELLAVIMMFYQPEKLHGMSSKNVKLGILKQLSNTLQCRYNNLSNLIPEIIVHFKAYDTFKSTVISVYKEIKNKF